jgi:hypothetical protein
VYLVGVEKVGWDKGGTEPTKHYTYFCANRNANFHLEMGF